MAANVQSKRPKLPKRKKRYQVTFDESVAGTLPMRTYRSEKPLPRPTSGELFIRAVAAVVSVLLILRLFEGLGLPSSSPLVKTLNQLTDPLIGPFRVVFGSVSVAAFFALIFVLVVAPILIHRFKDQTDSY